MFYGKCNRLSLFEETNPKSKLPNITNIQTIDAKEGTLLLSKWTP